MKNILKIITLLYQKLSFLTIILFLISSCSTEKFEKRDSNSSDKQEISNQENFVIEEKEPIEIAILMPISGANAALGRQYNSLIKLGLKDSLKTSIHVTSYDGSTIETIQKALVKIFAKNTKIIIGPLYSGLTNFVKQQIIDKDIILFTMSNDPSLANEQVIVFGHAPLRQLGVMLEYLTSHHYYNYITLLPEGKYAKNISEIVKETAIDNQGCFLRAVFYQNSPESINNAVDSLISLIDEQNEIDDLKAKPVIYISDEPSNLNLLLQKLKASKIDQKAIIATDNRFTATKEKNIELLFTGSLNFITSDVVAKSEKLGITNLSYMHLMAYDLGRIIAEYMGTNFDMRNFINKINNSENYVGVSGEINIVDKIAIRNYNILRQTENGKSFTIYIFPKENTE